VRAYVERLLSPVEREHGWQLGGLCPSAQLGQVVRGDEQRGGGRHQPWSHISQ
jgi:hypothetical protein